VFSISTGDITTVHQLLPKEALPINDFENDERFHEMHEKVWIEEDRIGEKKFDVDPVTQKLTVFMKKGEPMWV
jgi:hypothetical protein